MRPNLCEDRVVNSVPPPPWYPLTTSQLYQENSVPDLKRLQDHLRDGGLLSIECFTRMIQETTELLRSEPCCLDLWAPGVIVGDLHGQFFDLDALLCREFKEDGSIWLFLGDYVDRGNWGTEVCALLYAYKLNFPTRVYLLRGNHECRVITEKFNFKAECSNRYNESIYDLIMTSFDALPLAATLGTDTGTLFVVHGGLSPEIDTLDDINAIDRFREIPRFGPLCDLTWSDPLEESTANALQPKDMWEWWNVDFCQNPTRGIGQVFGFSAIDQFLSDNGLAGIIRAHETAREGFMHNWMCKEHETDRRFPYVTTVFSAPNYCGWYGNKGAIMVIDESGASEFKQFSEVENVPFVLPKNLNAFSYSLPILAEKVTNLLYNFFNLSLDEETESNLNTLTVSRTQLRQRILSLNQIQNSLQATNEKTTLLIKLKGLVGDQLPQEANQMSISSLTTLIHEYESAKQQDSSSELYPTLAKESSQTLHQDEEFWKGVSRRTGLTPRQSTPRERKASVPQSSPSQFKPRRTSS